MNNILMPHKMYAMVLSEPINNWYTGNSPCRPLSSRKDKRCYCTCNALADNTNDNHCLF
jgi:hypothetical protein